jgi:hypothetical protein
LPHTLLLERDGKEVRCRVEERGQDESTKIGHGKEKAELEDGIPAHQIIDWWLLASSPLVLRRYIWIVDIEPLLLDRKSEQRLVKPPDNIPAAGVESLVDPPRRPRRRSKNSGRGASWQGHPALRCG